MLAAEGADILGTNCGRDPERMLPVVELVRAATSGYVAAQPIGFRTRDDLPNFTQLPEFPLALDSLTLSRAEMAPTPPERGRSGSTTSAPAAARSPTSPRDGRGARAASARERQIGALDRHPGIQKSRTLEEMAGVKPKSADAPRFATGDRNW